MNGLIAANPTLSAASPVDVLLGLLPWPWSRPAARNRPAEFASHLEPFAASAAAFAAM